MKLQDLQDRLWERFKDDKGINDSTAVNDIARATIECLGFHVDHAGEICDPRPAPSAIPEQRNARWSGSGRRRR